ncbi:hypothetical protein BJ912DRAFT_933386 [Pholiota molesta]|nr:hypothetical protein BJ912DRAFT_933386 [Pholiota molesta]
MSSGHSPVRSRAPAGSLPQTPDNSYFTKTEDSPAEIPDSDDPLNAHMYAGDTIESQVFGTQVTPTKIPTSSRGAVFQYSQTEPTSPLPTRSAGPTQTGGDNSESAKYHAALEALRTARNTGPLVRRVPPLHLDSVLSKSPRKGQMAIRLHAFETHFDYFRQAHYDLMTENTILAHDLKVTKRKLSHEEALDRISELEGKLADANAELDSARHYFNTLREFADEGWSKLRAVGDNATRNSEKMWTDGVNYTTTTSGTLIHVPPSPPAQYFCKLQPLSQPRWLMRAIRVQPGVHPARSVACSPPPTMPASTTSMPTAKRATRAISPILVESSDNEDIAARSDAGLDIGAVRGGARVSAVRGRARTKKYGVIQLSFVIAKLTSL